MSYTYQPEEVVTLSAARGGWQGVISERRTVGASNAYLVWSLDPRWRGDGVARIVLEDDIESSQGFAEYPNWQVGDTVQLGKLSGEITAIDGTEYTVEVSEPEKHYTKVRQHTVPRWRLLIENN